MLEGSTRCPITAAIPRNLGSCISNLRLFNGGDLYTQFLGREVIHIGRDFSEALTDFFRNRDVVSVPARGRLIAQKKAQQCRAFFCASAGEKLRTGSGILHPTLLVR